MKIANVIAKKSDWWEQVEKSAKKFIKRGLQQAKEGKVTPHENVMKKHEKWLAK